MVRKITRPIIRTALEVSVVVILVVFFVTPAIKIEYRSPDSALQPVSAITVDVPNSTGLVSLNYNLSTQVPSHGATTTTVSIDLQYNQSEPPSAPASLVFGGLMAKSFQNCSSSQVKVDTSLPFDNLSEQERSVFLDQWTALIQANMLPGSHAFDFEDVQNQAAADARSQRYVRVGLDTQNQPITDSDGSVTPNQEVDTVCTFLSSDIWSSNGPDRLFDLPALHVTYDHTVGSDSKHDPSDGNFTYGSQIATSSDLSILGLSSKGTTAADQVSWSDSDVCTEDTSNQSLVAERVCLELSGTLRSQSAGMEDQQHLFVAGIALGIAGGIAANSLRSILDGSVVGIFELFRRRRDKQKQRSATIKMDSHGTEDDTS